MHALLVPVDSAAARQRVAQHTSRELYVLAAARCQQVLQQLSWENPTFGLLVRAELRQRRLLLTVRQEASRARQEA